LRSIASQSPPRTGVIMSDATADSPHPSGLGLSEEEEEVRLGQPIFDENLVALWTLYKSNAAADGVQWSITDQRLRAIPHKLCTYTGALVIAGIGITNPEGVIELSVSDFYCTPEADRLTFQLQEPIILTATAGGSQPIYMTTESSWGNQNNNELTLKFFSWGIGGRPVPNAVFRWHLTIAATYATDPP
jgi:hypothetical protein